jgi:hypothetical protein
MQGLDTAGVARVAAPEQRLVCTEHVRYMLPRRCRRVSASMPPERKACVNFPSIVHTVATSGSPPHRLSLKLGIPVTPKCACRAASPLRRHCSQGQMLQCDRREGAARQVGAHALPACPCALLLVIPKPGRMGSCRWQAGVFTAARSLRARATPSPRPAAHFAASKECPTPRVMQRVALARPLGVACSERRVTHSAGGLASTAPLPPRQGHPPVWLLRIGRPFALVPVRSSPIGC